MLRFSVILSLLIAEALYTSAQYCQHHSYSPYASQYPQSLNYQPVSQPTPRTPPSTTYPPVYYPGNPPLFYTPTAPSTLTNQPEALQNKQVNDEKSNTTATLPPEIPASPETTSYQQPGNLNPPPSINILPIILPRPEPSSDLSDPSSDPLLDSLTENNVGKYLSDTLSDPTGTGRRIISRVSVVPGVPLVGSLLSGGLFL